jgi:hypothetical protein
MRKLLMMLCVPVALAGCAAESIWAPDELVQRSIYRHDGPTALTLYTVVNSDSGNGAHSGLMVSGSQRVIFDPAGTFKHASIPERNDVVIGASPRIVDYYTDYHARETYHVIVQYVEVSPEVAERALQLVQSNGAVSKAMCASSISAILRQLPRFEGIGGTMFPNNLEDEFAAIPGVVRTEVYDDDSDNNLTVLRAITQ